MPCNRPQKAGYGYPIMRAHPKRAVVTAACAVVLAALVGCAPTGDESTQVEGVVVSTNPELATDPGVPVIADLEYGAVDGQPLLLDSCTPPDFDPLEDAARAA